MQNSATPGYRKTLPSLISNIRLLTFSFLLLVFAGFLNSANALPPGVPDFTNPNTRMVVIKDLSKADLTESNIVRAYVYDDLNNPVVGVAVYFTTVPGNVTVPVVTNASGIAEFAFSSGIVGDVVIDGRIGANHFNPTVTTTFVEVDPPDPPDPPDPTNPLSALIIDVDNSLANGTDSNIVHAHIVDQYGNPVANQTIDFAFTGAANTNGPLTVTTDAFGNAVLKLASTTIGSVTVTASVNGTPLINGNPATVDFVEGPPDVTVPTTKLQVMTTGAIADSVDINTVKATITDNAGHPLAGQMVIFKILSGTGSFIGNDTVFTDINGEASISLVSTVADTVFITATVTTSNTPIEFGSPAAPVFVAGPPDLNNPLTALIVDTDNADADGVSQNVVRAHIVDKYGNPVPAQTITFSYTGTATAGGPLTVTTDLLGNAVLTLTSTTVGQVDITAAVNGVPLIYGNPSAVHFTIFPDVNNPETNLSTVTDNSPADGVTTNSVMAHVIDNEGNPMPGALVTFTITSGDGEMASPQTVYTDANGNAYLLITSDKAGYVTVTATADDRQITFGSPARVRFTSIDVWVPRVFTPNGDGTNDYVRAIANGISVQYFNIYNRWGNLLFTTNDISRGWDGKFKGVVQPNETYLWILAGRRNINNERVEKRGMISLVK